MPLPPASQCLPGGWGLETGAWGLETGGWGLETGGWSFVAGDWWKETAGLGLEGNEAALEANSLIRIQFAIG